MTEFDQISAFFKARKFNEVISLATKIGADNLSKNPDGIAMLAMSQIFTNNSGSRNLARAVALGSTQAKIWTAVLDHFEVSETRSIDVESVFYQKEHEELRRSAYRHYPKEIHIETQTVCNAACTFCPYPKLERKGNKMPDELIDKIILDLKQIPKELKFYISPFKVSDPFLDKRIFSILKKINDELPNAIIRLFTNGSALTDNNLEATRKVMNLSNLWISLNEVDPTRYLELMGMKIDKVLSNLDNLHNKVETGYPHKVVLSRVSDNSSNDIEFLEYTKKRYPLFKSMLAKRSDWTGTVDEENLSAVPNLACKRWFEVSIMSDGNVSLCCMDGHGNYNIGDITQSSILEVYNSTDYKKMRQFSSSRLATSSPCDTCNL